MFRRPLSLLAAAVVAAGVSAQTKPPFTRTPSPSSIILSAFSSVPNNTDDLITVFHAKLLNNAAGEWTSVVSARQLPTAFGGDGVSADLLLGDFNPYSGQFLFNFEANALNSAEDELYCTLSVDGLWAILERPSGVYLANRAAVGTPFNAPVQVAGFAAVAGSPLAPTYFPAVGTVEGVQKILYSDGQDIVMRDFDLGTATMSGTPVVVSSPLQAGAVAISPSPVYGPDGDIEGLFLADMVVPKTTRFDGDADPMWAADLDPTTPPEMMVNRTDWQCCGGVAGGYVYFAHSIQPKWHLMHSEAVILTGDAEPIGGTVDLRTMADYDMAGPANPLQTIVLLAAGYGPAAPLPGFNGEVALDLATLTQLPVAGSTTNQDGITDLSFALPNWPALSGAVVPIQAVVANFATASLSFSNSASIQIR